MEDQHHLGQWITVKRNKQDEDIKIDSLIEKKKIKGQAQLKHTAKPGI